MNCKPGDLAVIVRASNPQNLGKIVRVGTYMRDVKFCDWPTCDAWTFDGPEVFSPAGLRVMFLRDELLRPIRDSDGEDETLTWAGKPADVHAPIVRLTEINALPQFAGGDPLRSWLGNSSTCGDSHAS